MFANGKFLHFERPSPFAFTLPYLATLLASMAAVGLGFLAAAGFWIAADRVGPPGLLLALLAVGALAVTAWRNRK